MSAVSELIAPKRLGRDFRWLLASSWVSNLGDGIALAAAPLLIASLTGSAILVAAGALLQVLPALLFGLHAGAISDRFDRRWLVLIANIARVAILAAMIGFLISGVATVGLVLVVAFLLGTAETLADTATSTLLPMMVRPLDIGVGNARLQAGFLVGNQLAGPSLGAFLFAAGRAWPFVAQLVCIALAVVLVARIATTSTEDADGAPRPPVRSAIVDGLRWTWRNPPVRTLVLIILTFNITWGAPYGIMVLYATEHLRMGAVGFGLLTTATAVGGVIATGVFGRLERHLSYSTLMRGALSLEVITHLAYALTSVGWIALIISGVFGFYAFVWGTISTTTRQRLVPRELQGRVSSVNRIGVFGGIVIGQALGGVIAQVWGPTGPFWFAFVGSGLTLAIIWRPISNLVRAVPSP